MSDKEPALQEMEARVRRTQSLMKVGTSLREYKDQMDDIIKAINSDDGFHSDMADNCIKIGIGMQELASALRRLSIEEVIRAKRKKAKSKWNKCKEQMSKTLEREEYQAWLEKFSEKLPQGSYQRKSWELAYYGPNQHFIESHIDIDDDNT